MTDDTDRYDRFVSEMQIFKTPEEAWAAHDAHKAKLKAERAARLERLKVQRADEQGNE